MDIQQLSKMLTQYAKTRQWSFLLRGNVLTPEEVFSPAGLLPGLAKRADQMSALCFGYGIGIDLPSSEKTSLGYMLTLRPDASPFILLITLVHTLEDLKQKSKSNKIRLDELLYE